MEIKDVITASNLSIGYNIKGKKTAVQSNLDFSLKGGNLTCLLGPNGAGKSTLLRTISASQSILDGSLTLMDKPIARYTEKELSRTIGLVLTERIFAGALTVRQLVALGRQPHTGFFGRLSVYDKEIIDYALHLTGISHKAENYTANLSDGERHINAKHVHELEQFIRPHRVPHEPCTKLLSDPAHFCGSFGLGVSRRLEGSSDDLL